jgi:type IV pilus assembly protein PilF
MVMTTRCRRFPALVAVLALALAHAACVTTTNGAPPPEESPGEAAEYNVQLGANYLAQGRLELAKEKIEKALEQDDSLPVAHTYAGLLYDRLNEVDKASFHYRRALRLAPNDPVALNLYGVFVCRQGDPAGAEQYFVKATLDPLYRTPEAAFTNAGVCLLRDQQQERAEGYFRRALESNPRYADALWEMARLSHSRSLPLQARAFFQRYAEVSTMSSEALWLGLRIERELGNQERASRYADELLADFPDSVEARELMQSGWAGNG